MDEIPPEPNPVRPERYSNSLSVEEKNWAMGVHLAGLAGLLGIPFGNVLGPLIIWLLKKDEMPFVNRAGREAINFQISMTIYFFIGGILYFILIGFLVIPLLILAYLVLTVVGAIKAKDGEHYRYPFTLRLV